MTDAQLRHQLVEYARLLAQRGWVANHDGNVTHRLAEAREGARFLATPTSTAKARVTSESLLVVDETGAKVGQAGGRPFSEISLHLAVYAARPDVKAVVHAHPPTATGFAVSGKSLDAPFIAEAVVSIGPGIPTVPFAAPGASSVSALKPYLAEHDAVLLGNHGVLAWGVDLEQAYLRMELVEHLAKVALVAHQLGGVQPLPASVLPALAEARTKAGLGPRARGVTSSSVTSPSSTDSRPAVIACAPGPSDAPVRVRDDKRDEPRHDLAAIIRDEITRALKTP